MNLTCPCCHAKYPLEAAFDSEAAGELQLILAQAASIARPLVAYLGLFRSKSRALSFDRACRLAREVLELGADPRALGAALVETVEAMRIKRDAGQVKPLSNHNYLKRVLESVADRPENIPQIIPSDFAASIEFTAKKSKRAQAIELLAEWGAGDWLRSAIADGLAALVALGRDGTPAADVITRTADVWHHVLAGSCNIEAVDSRRVKEGFSGLIKAVESWPEPKAIWKHMPARPQRRELEEPPPDPEQVRAAKAKFDEMVASVVGGEKKETKKDEEERRRELREQARQLCEKGDG